jgi:hypothetical protein
MNEREDPPSREAMADEGAPSREEIAAEACAGGRVVAGAAVPRMIPNKHRTVQVAPTSRKLFDKAGRKVFLEWFAGTGNLSLSARKAGFHYRTVLRHRAKDAKFREEFDLALDQSEVRVRAWLMEAKEKGEEADDEGTGFDPSGPAELDTHAPANLNVDQALDVLRNNNQRRAAAAEAAAGRRRGAAYRIATNEEVEAALVKRLAAFSRREEARRREEGEN